MSTKEKHNLELSIRLWSHWLAAGKEFQLFPKVQRFVKPHNLWATWIRSYDGNFRPEIWNEKHQEGCSWQTDLLTSHLENVMRFMVLKTPNHVLNIAGRVLILKLFDIIWNSNSIVHPVFALGSLSLFLNLPTLLRRQCRMTVKNTGFEAEDGVCALGHTSVPPAPPILGLFFGTIGRIIIPAYVLRKMRKS